ncbi:MAG: hypothetical protein OXF54_14480 [Caldilineaceae bacterium]|nr:hypothetical protein [Caldilineaceae bacterium]
MASITVRNLEEDLKRRLRVRAAENGRSTDDEARVTLRTALYCQPQAQQDLAAAIRSRFAPLGGVELELPLRSPMRQPPRFD